MQLSVLSAHLQNKAADAHLVVVDHGDGHFSVLKDTETPDLPGYRVDIIKIMQRLRSINGTLVLWVSMPGS
jgi:hypothetical protein